MEIGFFTRTEIKTQRAAVKMKAPAKTRKKSTKVAPLVAKQEETIPIDFGIQDCTNCGLLLDPNIQYPGTIAEGDMNPELYFLSAQMTVDDDNVGHHFSGKSGTYLKRFVTTTARYCSCLCCRPPLDREPTDKELWCCRKYVEEDIEYSKPAVIVGVGAIPLRWAINATTPTLWRGRFVPITVGNHSCWFYSILDPKFVLKSGYQEEDWEEVFQRDLYNLQSGDYEKLGNPVVFEPTIDGVIFITPEKKNLHLLKEFLGESSGAPTAVDIETTHLRPYYDDSHILSIAISNGKRTVVFPYDHPSYEWDPDSMDELREMMAEYLVSEDDKWCHNAAFELEWFAVKVTSAALTGRYWQDTMVQGYILDERFQGLSLDFLCLENLGMHLKQASDMDRKNMRIYPLTELLPYNAMDAKYTFILMRLLERRLKVEDLQEVYEFQVERIPALVGAQMIGLAVVPERIIEIGQMLAEKITTVTVDILGSDCVSEYQQTNGIFNPGSAKQVAVLLKDIVKAPELKGTKTGKDILETISHPIARQILEYRKYKKLESTYLTGYNVGGKYVYPDGKVHTTFTNTSTVTGRLSSSGPNLQNFPAREDSFIRGILGAPPGYTMVSFDYGQIEARVVAMMSKDATLVKALWDNYDIHMVWAEKLAAKNASEYKAVGRNIKKFRSIVKNTFTFPLIYGAISESISKNIGTSVGVMDGIIAEFWETFPGIRAWQITLQEQYHKFGYVECLTGRRRRMPLTDNQLFNAPVQGTASDIVVDSMIRLSRLSQELDIHWLHPAVNIHDDLTYLLPTKKLEAGMEVIVEEMVRKNFPWINVPITIEAKIGPDWANLKEIGVFSSDE